MMTMKVTVAEEGPAVAVEVTEKVIATATAGAVLGQE
jgi:hypothetical protein